MALQGTVRSLNVFFKSNNFFTTWLKPQLPVIVSAATICSKELRDPSYQRAKPFPYETKKFSNLYFYLDGTMKRFDENTKVIVVDGNIGAGKTSFAKQLAEQFDFKFIPEPSMDRYYITPYGHDLRLLDPLMPPSFKTCDVKTFYQNPNHRNVPMFQMKMFILRYIDYIEALAHLLNTGQGIVMDRSVYSDFVFMETMCRMGYVRPEVLTFYKKVYENCVVELLRPHLVVYLDVSPDTALKRIKERNDPVEINTKVLTKEYLQCIEDVYKEKHLKILSKHSDVLIYDWNEYGDLEVVIEDIEAIDFDTIDRYSDRLMDWSQDGDWDWGTLRHKFTNESQKLLQYSHFLPFGIDELFHPASEILEYKEIMKKVPGMRYIDGFNKEMGDNIWFKTRNNGATDKHDYFPFLDR